MGSVYPGAFDNFTTGVLTGVISGTDHGNKADAIDKIEAELGLDPSGSSATVAARLDSVESTHVVAAPPTGVAATDTAAIVAAVAQSVALGLRQVQLDVGTYILNATVSLPSNFTIRGHGIGATVVKRPGAGSFGSFGMPGRIFTNSDQSAFGANVDIGVFHMTLDRSEATNLDPYDNCIHFRYVDGVEVAHCRIRGGGSSCHIEACDNTRVHHNRVDSFTDKGLSCSHAVGFGGTNLTNPMVTFNHNTVKATTAGTSSPLLNTQPCVWDTNTVVSTVALGGSCLEIGDADDTLVVDNKFVGGGVLVGSGARVHVVTNKLYDGAVAGSAKIVVSKTGTNPDPIRTVIQGNYLHCVLNGNAISGHTNAHMLKVTDNTVTGGGSIRIDGDDCDTIDNTVEGSLAQGFFFGGSALRPQIRGNTARDCGQDPAGSATTKVGFVFDSLTDPTIRDNLAVSSKVATADMKNAYYINASTGILWRDNFSKGHTTGVLTTTNTPTYVQGSILVGSVAYDAPSVAVGAQTTTTVTVAGAAVGDLVTVSIDKDLQSMTLTGYVSAANTVTAVLRNGTAGALDLAAGTLRAIVEKP